jgi:hypothetical protein
MNTPIAASSGPVRSPCLCCSTSCSCPGHGGAEHRMLALPVRRSSPPARLDAGMLILAASMADSIARLASRTVAGRLGCGARDPPMLWAATRLPGRPHDVTPEGLICAVRSRCGWGSCGPLAVHWHRLAASVARRLRTCLAPQLRFAVTQEELVVAVHDGSAVVAPEVQQRQPHRPAG